MFEQTFLTHAESGRKTGAIAASFVAQMLAVGVLLVGPLIYTQTLPLMARLPEVMVFRPPVAPPPVEVVTTTENSAPARVAPRMFVPTTVPKGAPRQTVVTDLITTLPPDAIVIADPGVGVVDVPPLMPRIAAPELVKEPAPTITAAPVPDLSKPLRISGGVLAAKLITQVVPKYPPVARQTRVSGIVRLLGVIDRDGRVRNLRVLDGPPLLRQAALDAVGQWVYAPTLLNGQPVEVEAPIEVHFQLN